MRSETIAKINESVKYLLNVFDKRSNVVRASKFIRGVGDFIASSALFIVFVDPKAIAEKLFGSDENMVQTNNTVLNENKDQGDNKASGKINLAAGTGMLIGAFAGAIGRFFSGIIQRRENRKAKEIFINTVMKLNRTMEAINKLQPTQDQEQEMKQILDTVNFLVTEVNKLFARNSEVKLKDLQTGLNYLQNALDNVLSDLKSKTQTSSKFTSKNLNQSTANAKSNEKISELNELNQFKETTSSKLTSPRTLNQLEAGTYYGTRSSFDTTSITTEAASKLSRRKEQPANQKPLDSDKVVIMMREQSSNNNTITKI